MSIQAFLPRIAAGDLASALVLADWLDEHNDPRAARARELARVTPRELAERVYARRRNGAYLAEGDMMHGGRWYPSDREDGGDIVGRVRPPSRRWPWSYRRACRTRKHCTALVLRALAGHDVPHDVGIICRGPVDALLLLLAPYRVVAVGSLGTSRQGCLTPEEAYALRDALLDDGYVNVRIEGLPTTGATGAESVPL